MPSHSFSSHSTLDRISVQVSQDVLGAGEGCLRRGFPEEGSLCSGLSRNLRGRKRQMSPAQGGMAAQGEKSQCRAPEGHEGTGKAGQGLGCDQQKSKKE